MNLVRLRAREAPDWAGNSIPKLGLVELRPGAPSGKLRSAVSPALSTLAVVTIVATLAAAHLKLDGYGLLHSLPFPYYVALAALPFASALEWRRPSPRSMLIAAQVVTFLLAVWLTPYVLEGTPRFRTSYLSWGYVDPLIRGDGLLPHQFVYHNWPLFPLAFAALHAVTHISPLSAMAFFPTVIMLVYLVPLAALLRIGAAPTVPLRPPTGTRWREVPTKLLGPDGRWMAGVWLFVVFQWTNQDYFSPQALVFTVYLSLLAVLAHVAIRRQGRFDVFTTLTTLVLFSLIVEIHVLTALIALVVMWALTATGLLRRPALVLVCTLLFLVWQAWPAAPFFGFYGHRLLQTVFAAGDFLQTNVSGRLAGSGPHLFVGRVRLAVTVVAFATGLLALVPTLGARRWRPAPRRWFASLSPTVRFALVCLIATVLVGPVSVYGGEMLIRTVLFSLPPLAMIVAATIDRRLTMSVLVAAVVLMAPIHIVSHYGNELYDYVSPGEIAGFRYIADHLAPAKVYGGFPGGAFLDTAHLQWRNSTVPSAKTVPAAGDFLRPEHKWGHSQWPIYVAFDRGDVAAATIFYNRPHLIQQMHQAVANDPLMHLVYASRDFAIYRWLPSGTRRCSSAVTRNCSLGGGG